MIVVFGETTGADRRAVGPSGGEFPADHVAVLHHQHTNDSTIRSGPRRSGLLQRAGTISSKRWRAAVQGGAEVVLPDQLAQAYELHKGGAEFADLKTGGRRYGLYTGTGTIANFTTYAQVLHAVVNEYVPETIADAVKFMN